MEQLEKIQLSIKITREQLKDAKQTGDANYISQTENTLRFLKDTQRKLLTGEE